MKMEGYKCRICLQNSERPFKLDDKVQGRLIWEAINEIANVFVTVGDSFPQWVCLNCSTNLEQAIKFKIEVEKSDEMLHNNEFEYVTIIKTEDNDEEQEMTEEYLDTQPNILEPTVIIKSKRGRIIKQKRHIYEEDDNGVDTTKKNQVKRVKTESEKVETKVDETIEELSDTPEIKNEPKPLSRKRKSKQIEHRCCMCQQLFNEEDELIAHVESTHSDQITTNLGKKFITRQTIECKYCLLRFRSRKFLRQHFEIPNFKEPPRKRTYKPKVKGENVVCIVCGKISSDMHESRMHELRVHAVDFPVVCAFPGCVKRFSAEIIMKKHMRIHKERTHICDVCGKAFPTAKWLEKHTYVHKDTKPLKCSYCPKTFIHNNALKVHEESHTQEKVWSCDQCERTYKWKEDLQKHVRGVHLGDHPYKCKYCNKGYFCSSSRKYHQDRCQQSDEHLFNVQYVK